MSKITLEVHIGMPKSKLGKATLSISIDPKEAEKAIGATEDPEITNATLEKYVRGLLADNMTLAITNGREATKTVREARRRAQAA